MKKSTELFLNMCDNYTNLTKALVGQRSTDILETIKMSIDSLNELADDIIGKMEIDASDELPTRVLKLQGEMNINGGYYNLPAHTSTADLLSRMNIQMHSIVYIEKDIKILHNLKKTSYQNKDQGSNREGGYFIFQSSL